MYEEERAREREVRVVSTRSHSKSQTSVFLSFDLHPLIPHLGVAGIKANGRRRILEGAREVAEHEQGRGTIVVEGGLLGVEL